MAMIIPPPYYINEIDKRGLVVVFAAITLFFFWTCACIRLWLRWRLIQSWGLDDCSLGGATALTTGQSIVVLHAVNSGLGKSLRFLSRPSLNSIGKNELAANELYICSLLLSKWVIIFLYLRLTPNKKYVHVLWALVFGSAIWACISATLIVVSCNDLDFWLHGTEKCPTLWPRWQAIGAIDVITEVSIILTSFCLVAKLNMHLKYKLMVIFAFSTRLPVIIAAAFRLHYLHATFSSADRTLDGAYYAIATQWHIGYAIMSTTITGLGPFLRPFSKSSPSSYYRSSDYDYRTTSTAATSGRSHDENLEEPLELKIMRTHENSDPSSLSQTPPLMLVSEQSRGTTLITGGGSITEGGFDEDTTSRNSREIQRWIIRKTTEFAVETDHLSGIRDSHSSW